MQERDWLCFRVIAAVHPPIVHSGHLIPGQFEMVSLTLRAHCPDGEKVLPGLEDEVHGGPNAAVATSIAPGLEDGLSSA